MGCPGGYLVWIAHFAQISYAFPQFTVQAGSSIAEIFPICEYLERNRPLIPYTLSLGTLEAHLLKAARFQTMGQVQVLETVQDGQLSSLVFKHRKRALREADWTCQSNPAIGS